MGKVLVVLVLLGAGGFALYKYVLKPQPAYDISQLEKVVDLYNSKFQGRRAALEGAAMGGTMPARGVVADGFFTELGTLLEDYIDCESGRTDMQALYARTIQQSGHIDQAAIMKDIMGASRAEQQAMVAQMALMYHRHLTHLLPLVQEFCDSCPEESDIFNQILRL